MYILQKYILPVRSYVYIASRITRHEGVLGRLLNRQAGKGKGKDDWLTRRGLLVWRVQKKKNPTCYMVDTG